MSSAYLDYNPESDLLIAYNPKPLPEWIAAMLTIPKRTVTATYSLWQAPFTSVALDILLSACKGFELRESLLAKLPERRRVKVERDRRDAQATAAALKVLDVESPLPNGDRLFAHQKQAAKWLIERRRVILADDMGLGKTRTALIAAKAWQLPIVVIAPKSLLINWQREAELCQVAISTFTWGKPPAAPGGDFVLICDEAHYAQSLKSKRTGAAIELATSPACRAVYLLSGTPIKNGRPANLYPLLVMLGHWIAADKHGYESTYCDARQETFNVRSRLPDGRVVVKSVSVWNTDGAKNLDKLHKHIKDILIRRTKKECLDLPPKTRVYREIEMAGETEKVYLSRLTELKTEYKKNIQAAPGDAGDKELMIIQLMTAYRQAGSRAKCATAIEIAGEVIEQGGKVVLFTAFKETAAAVAAALKCNALTGDQSGNERQRAIDGLQTGDDRALVCTFGAGGVGVTLTAAQTVILIDRVWTPGDCAQAEDRLHRIGQTNNVTAIWLQVDTMDAEIDRLLITKQTAIDLVLKGKRRTLRNTATPGEIASAVAELVFG